MKTQSLIAALVIVALIVAPTRAHADCDDGNTDCAAPLVVLIEGGIIAGSVLDGVIAVGGLVTMIGGANDVAHHRWRAGWRIANYVLAGANFGVGAIWGVLAANRTIDPQLGLAVAVPQLAIGAADLTVALLSSTRGRDVVAVSIAPMAGRDISGHAINGASLALTF